MNRKYAWVLIVGTSLTSIACGDTTSDLDSAPSSLDSGREVFDAGRDQPDAGAIDFDAGPTPCDTPGEIVEVACGRCGTLQRVCGVSGFWEQGSCEGEAGLCTPGERGSSACGMCGAQAEVCTAECVWETSGECAGEGGCVPGELVRSADGCDVGRREFRCDEACQLQPLSGCASDDCDVPGASEVVACGNCGQTTRFCSVANLWDYGACESEGICVPGTSDTASCGSCGSQARRCDDTCQWTDSGSCTSEGECAPATVRRISDGCSGSDTRVEVCDDACAFGPPGECEAPTGQAGDDCTDAVCIDGLFCDSQTGGHICRQTCPETGDTCETGFCLRGDPLICSDECVLFDDSSCPAGMTCRLAVTTDESHTQCSSIGTGVAGSDCASKTDCGPGLTCILSGGPAICKPFCSDDMPCPSGQTCDLGAAPFHFCR